MIRRGYAVLIAAATLLAASTRAETPTPDMLPSETPPPDMLPAQTWNTWRATLSARPSVRVVLHLRTDDGAETEVEWDPAELTGLSRLFTLSGEKRWVANASSEFFESGTSRTRCHFVSVDKDVAHDAKVDLLLSAVDPLVASSAGKSPPFQITINKATTPSLASLKAAIGGGSGEVVRGRAWDDKLPEYVEDLFKALGQIAFDRTKRKAMSLLQGRLAAFLCTDLRVDRKKIATTVMACVVDKNCEIKKDLIEKSSEPLLPATCDAVRNLRLQELASVARELYTALGSDLLSLLKELVVESLAYESTANSNTNIENLLGVATVEAIKAIVASLGSGVGAKSNAIDAQTLLSNLSRIDWSKGTHAPGSGNDIGTGSGKSGKLVDLAFAVLGACHIQNGCDSRQIVRLLSNPAAMMEATAASKFKPTAAEVSIVSNWVVRAQRLTEPGREGDPTGLIKDAVELALDAVMIAQGSSADKTSRAMVSKMRSLFLAMAARDPAQALVAVAGILQWVIEKSNSFEKNSRSWVAVQKVSALLGAVMAYASTYSPDAKGDRQQLQEARKQAIESLIDATTDRRHRDGEWVASIGASVGFGAVGSQYVVSAEKDKKNSLFYGQLTLPMGVGVQFLPDGRNKKLCALKTHTGFHLQLSVIDLAQFVSLDGNNSITAPTWSNFVTVALYLGLIVGTPSSTVVIGTDVRWAPTLFSKTEMENDATNAVTTTKRSGAMRVGLLITYYVPFFDFN